MAFMESKRRRRMVLETSISIVLLFVFGVSSSSCARGQTLRQIAKFDLPGPGGKRFDYLTIDDEIAEVVSGVKPVRGADSVLVKWPELVEKKRESWPISFLVPGGAYIEQKN